MGSHNLCLFFIVSTLVVSESDAWFHKPRCPPKDPKCCQTSHPRPRYPCQKPRHQLEVNKRQVYRSLDKMAPTVPADLDSPDRLLFKVMNSSNSKRARNDTKYRTRIQRYRFKHYKYT